MSVDIRVTLEDAEIGVLEALVAEGTGSQIEEVDGREVVAPATIEELAAQVVKRYCAGKREVLLDRKVERLTKVELEAVIDVAVEAKEAKIAEDARAAEEGVVEPVAPV